MENNKLPSLLSLVNGPDQSTSSTLSEISLGSAEAPTKENFDLLYEQFIKRYHKKNSCRIPDHLNKFNDSPTYQKKTFDTFELFQIVRDCGGISKLQKLPRQWTNSQSHLQPSSPRNWTQVASMLGYDTKATNISFRIKEWLRFHHIDAFFDYLMGIPNPFYSEDYEPARYSSMSSLNTSPRSVTSQLTYSESPDAYSDNLGYDTESLRKRSFEKLKTLARKRSSSLLHSMNTLSVDEKTSLDELDTFQLHELVTKLTMEVEQLRLQCSRYEEHFAAKDQRIYLLQQELDDKNHLLNKSAQFKELLVRYMDLL